jgi:hypothetical protein
MTPKEKAEELIKRFNKVEIFINIEPSNIETDLKNVDCDASKQCALIAVDEILSFMDLFDLDIDMSIQFIWWQKVKQEIEKL